MKRIGHGWVGMLVLVLVGLHPIWGAVPETLSFQGRVLVAGVAFQGTGQFKFALVDAGDQPVWSSGSVTGLPDGEPDAAINLPVNRGLYQVTLGEGMAFLPSGLFEAHGDLHLRVWFNDGTHGFQRLTPDQPLTAVAYARRSASAEAADGVTGVVEASQLTGTVDVARLPGTVARLDSGATFAGPVTAPKFQGQGALPLVESQGASTAAVPNTAYAARREDGVGRFTLPTSAVAGDLVRVAGIGAGGWQVDGLPAGVHWTVGTANLNWSSVASSADGLRWLAAGTGAGLYGSLDGGSSWSSFPAINPQAWSAVAMSADGQRLGALGTGSQIHLSANGGATWTAREVARSWKDLACSSDGQRWAAVVQNGQIHLSPDGGGTWLARENNRPWSSIAMSGDGRRLVAATTGGPLFVSEDWGGTWVGRGTARTWVAVATSWDGNRTLAADQGGQLYVSADFGGTWTARENVRLWQSVAMSWDGRVMGAVERGGRAYVSTDGGVNWVARESPRPWTGMAMSSWGTRMAAVSAPGPICVSEGKVSGGAGAVGEFQYSGEGVWREMQYAMLGEDGRLPSTALPDVPASRVTSGVLDPARIPVLDASAIGTGVLDAARIPPHSADLLVSGKIGKDMLPGRLGGRQIFENEVGVHVDPFSDYVMDGTPLVVMGNPHVNNRFGYCIGLGYRDEVHWKIGVDRSRQFSIGAAGRRDDDISIEYYSGNAGIGMPPREDEKLGVNGDLYVAGGGYAEDGFWLSSDARHKRKVDAIAEPLQRLEALRGVGFEWRTGKGQAKHAGGRQLGFLAQEVAAVLPELVRTNRDGFLTVNYEGVIPVVVEAVKSFTRHQAARLAEKDAQIAGLEARLARLEAALHGRREVDGDLE